MAHRIVHPIKHAGKIHAPGKVVNWPAEVTEDLVKLGALSDGASAPAGTPEKSAETQTPADPPKPSDPEKPATPAPEKPVKPGKPGKK